MIVSSDATRKGAWANFYRFFNRYKWCVDEVLLTLLALIIDRFYQHGITIILAVDDTLCRKRGRQVFFSTTTQLNVPCILRTYAMRWSIEVTFENCKQLLGISDAAVRKEQAVRRVAPMAGVLYGLIFLWFDAEGHRHVQFPDRPWYRNKRTPSFGDMLTTLRRLSWEEKVKVAEKQGALKKVVAQLTYFLSLAG